MNANLGLLQFYFSEPVQANMVNVRSVVVYSAPSATAKGAKKVALTSTTTVDTSSHFTLVVTLFLSPTDLNTLKYRYPIIRNASTSWLTVTQDFAVDTFFNPNVPISAPAQVFQYIYDTTPPAVSVYTIDMQLGMISLTMSESVHAVTFDGSQFTLQSQAQRRFGSSVTIGDSTVTVGTDWSSAYISLQLSMVTLNTLKFKGIGTANVNVLLSWTNKAATDQFGNYLPPLWDASIAGNQPMLPSQVLPDLAPPVLQRWQIDLVSWSLYMFFSEPVVLLNVSKITLYDDTTGTSKPQPLGPAVVSVTNGSLNTRLVLKFRDVCAWPSLSYSCAPVVTVLPTGASSTRAPANTFFSTLSAKGRTFSLGILQGAFQDFAAVPNVNNAIGIGKLLPQMPPNCGLCPVGTYTSAPCTAISDRVCSRCTACAAGTWMSKACDSSGNIVCKGASVFEFLYLFFCAFTNPASSIIPSSPFLSAIPVCQACMFNTYVSTACLAQSDTVCSPCSTCPVGTYQVQSCELGNDVICSTCYMCNFPNDRIRRLCESGKYFYWEQQNCCWDENGVQISCEKVALANMFISVVKGKHKEELPMSNSVLPKAI